MGYWGMGLAQNDEFCEIYERFMDEYDAGRPVEEISAELLEEWLEAFDAADGVMHNVWFALAKAQWMCGGAAPDVLAQVERIVESGADLAYLKELEASERDLKSRQKALALPWGALCRAAGIGWKTVCRAALTWTAQTA